MTTFTYNNDNILYIVEEEVVEQSLMVFGTLGNITDVSILLWDLRHDDMQYIDIRLVAPEDATNFLFWSDVGHGNIVGNFTITDNAGSHLPTGWFGTGTYLPTGYDDSPYMTFWDNDTDSNRAGPEGGSTFASVFNGLAPNGDWTIQIAYEDFFGDGFLRDWFLTITTDSDDAQVDGTAGDDQMIVSATSATAGSFDMNGSGFTYSDLTGTFYLNGLDGNDLIVGSDGADVIEGGEGSDELYGKDGNDILIGGNGFDLLDGGRGVDTADYALAEAAVTVDLRLLGLMQSTGGSGIDTLVGIENLTGSAFGDRLTGNDGVNALAGLLGDDLLAGGAGNDSLAGGEGSDILSGDAGDDSLDGGEDRDTASYASAETGVTVSLRSLGMAQDTIGSGTDTLIAIENLDGSMHADTLTGSGLSNWLYGNDGGDYLNGLYSADRLYGGAGNDELIGGFGFDRLEGGEGNDDLNGNYGNDVLLGEAGNDTINGNYGNDTLYGDDGEDLLIGGVGADVIFGGLGMDDIVGGVGADELYGDEGDDTISGGEGNDTIYGGDGGDNLDGGIGMDTIHGGKGVDDISGANGDDTIYGGLDDDNLKGGSGADALHGEEGNDALVGDYGADTLDGGAGDDLLHGGFGVDTLTGGSGGDVFEFLELGDSSASAAAADTITDFSRADGDLITIDNLGDMLFIGNAAFSGIAGELRYEFDGAGDTLVRFDMDGDGATDMTIRLVGEITLEESDFFGLGSAFGGPASKGGDLGDSGAIVALPDELAGTQTFF